jgi:hypothetical protein
MVCRKWGLSGDEKNIVEVSKFQTEDWDLEASSLSFMTFTIPCGLRLPWALIHSVGRVSFSLPKRSLPFTWSTHTILTTSWTLPYTFSALGAPTIIRWKQGLIVYFLYLLWLEGEEMLLLRCPYLVPLVLFGAFATAYGCGIGTTTILTCMAFWDFRAWDHQQQ